jgi:hypothetical protein
MCLIKAWIQQFLIEISTRIYITSIIIKILQIITERYKQHSTVVMCFEGAWFKLQSWTSYADQGFEGFPLFYHTYARMVLK